MLTVTLILVCIVLVQIVVAGCLGLLILRNYTKEYFQKKEHAKRFIPITSPQDLYALDDQVQPLPSAWHTDPYSDEALQ